MKLKVRLTIGGSEAVRIFELASDGWYQCQGYAINPDKTVCVTDPWFADYVCSAPRHEFKILEEEE